jgi:hypothetical protein
VQEWKIMQTTQVVKNLEKWEYKNKMEILIGKRNKMKRKRGNKNKGWSNRKQRPCRTSGS